MAKNLGQVIRKRIYSSLRHAMLAALVVLLGIPAGFALIDDDRLRMSDDYAAVIGGVSIAVLLIAAFDMHYSLDRAKELAARGGQRPKKREEAIRHHVNQLTTWLTACSLLVVSLGLVILWAAIENHGPARWLAWFSLTSVCLGLHVVLTSALWRIQRGIRELFDLIPEEDEPQDPDAQAQAPSPPGQVDIHDG